MSEMAAAGLEPALDTSKRFGFEWDRYRDLYPHYEEQLAAHLARFGEGPDRLMLTSNTGASLRRSMWGKAYRSAVKSVGIDSSTHDLRHHCASVLISLGASITAVQQYLGHKNALETLTPTGISCLETRIGVRAAIDTSLRQNVRQMCDEGERDAREGSVSRGSRCAQW